MMRLIAISLLALVVSACTVQKHSGRTLRVAQDGRGDYTSIQAAIDALSDTAPSPRRIIIAPGLYREKIYLTKHQVILEGADPKTTIITQDIARDEWRCTQPDDWGVATFNISANDVTLKNLSIANEYGFNHKEARLIDCPADSVMGKRTITPQGHQMALRTKDHTTTRFAAINCHFKSKAGDTVSPWNLQDGMFYFKDCYMEGGVDFYCPRGFAWAENCIFYAHQGSAAIWHDGSGNRDHKTVIKNSRFDGYAGFNLGRYHREAQFILIDNSFSKNMADRDIFFVPGNQLQWGRRVYYTGNVREGGNYSWMQDNLHEAPGNLTKDSISPAWLFQHRWDPEKTVL